MKDKRTWDRDGLDNCRQSDDYYYGQTCTTHLWSYMPDDDKPCERALIHQVREKHHNANGEKWCVTCEGQEWPCETAMILDGVE